MAHQTQHTPPQMVLTSAPGKIIFHGEHAVVHGTTALASSLNLRSYIQLTSTPSTIGLSFPDLGLKHTWNSDDIDEAFTHLIGRTEDSRAYITPDGLEKLKEFTSLADDSAITNLANIAFLNLYICIFKTKSSSKLPSLSACATSNLPTGAGLGSSAAFSASLATALLLSSGAISFPTKEKGWSSEERDLINRWAYEGERVIHGNPSGIDNAVSVSGGALCYKTKIFQTLNKMPSLRVLIVNTKVPRSTKVLVAGVKDRLEKYPGVIKPVFDSIEDISARCQTILSSLWEVQHSVVLEDGMNVQETELYQTMEELIDMNQDFLRILGVSHPSIDRICSVTSEFGIHAKLTGAGGGGCVFAVIRPDYPEEKIQTVMSRLEEHGYESWVTSIGGVGVMYHCDVEDVTKNGFNLPKNFKP